MQLTMGYTEVVSMVSIFMLMSHMVLRIRQSILHGNAGFSLHAALCESAMLGVKALSFLCRAVCKQP